MKTRQPESLQEARRLRRKRRLRNRRIALVVSAVVLLMLIAVGVLLAVMEVTAIYVEGKTRYTYEEIVRESGLAVGQNLLSINKQAAHDRLQEAFPYLDTIEVGNASFSELRITVKEVKVLAAVQVGKDYMMMGTNNRALERVSADKVPADLLKIKGATLNSEKPGEELLDARSLRICQTLLASAENYKLSGMTTIDITQKTDISFWLNERLEVLLGGESNLANQIAWLAHSLPTIYENEGKEVEGQYDMTGYVEGELTPKCILTHKSELEEQEKLEQKEPEKDDTDQKPEETPEE